LLINKNKKQKQTVMTSNRPSNYAKLSYTQKVSRINRKLRTGNERIVNEAYDMTRGRVSNAVKLSSF